MRSRALRLTSSAMGAAYRTHGAGLVVRVVTLGGANEIGGSCLVVQAHDLTVVVDCGVRPKASGDRYPPLEQIPGTTAAVIVTHAHADHIGGLPLLAARRPGVPVFATAATIHVAQTMLRDSVTLQERDWVGGADFGHAEVDELLRRCVPVPYHTDWPVAESATARMTARLIPAGHILGAALLVLDVESLITGAVERVVVTGDISTAAQPTIAGLRLADVSGLRPALLVCEGTYGVERHRDPGLQEALFVQKVASVLERGGRVLVPAFAIGRAQNVALVLRDAMRDPRAVRRALKDPTFTLPDCAVWMDGLCRSVSNHFADFPGLLPKGRRHGNHPIYDERVVRPVLSAADRRRILDAGRPAVIVASSGMLTGGASVEWLRALGPDSRSAVLLTGYQDEESPGASLLAQHAGADARILQLADGTTVGLQCEVAMYGMSAHADGAQIAEVVRAIEPERVALVHGTPLRLTQLADALRAEGHVVEVPSRGEALEVRQARGHRRPHSAVSVGADQVTAQWLRGQVLHQALQARPAVPVVSAALASGLESALSDEDLARAAGAATARTASTPGEVAYAHRAAMEGEGLLFVNESRGRSVVHVPTLPDWVRPLALLSQEVERRIGREVEQAARELHATAKSAWAVVDGVGVAEQDLILFWDIGPHDLRLSVGVVHQRTKQGLQVAAPGAASALVLPHLVVGRVGPWPALSGVPGVLSPAEVRLLRDIGEAVPALVAVQAINSAVGAPAERTVPLTYPIWRAIAEASGLLLRGSLTRLGAGVVLAGADAAACHRQPVGLLEFAERLLPWEHRASPGTVAAALQEVQRQGLVHVDDTDDGLWFRFGSTAGAASGRAGPHVPAGEPLLSDPPVAVIEAVVPLPAAEFHPLLLRTVARVLPSTTAAAQPLVGVIGLAAHPAGRVFRDLQRRLNESPDGRAGQPRSRRLGSAATG